MPSSPTQQGQDQPEQHSKKLLFAAVGILLAIILANLNKIKGSVRPTTVAPTVTSEYLNLLRAIKPLGA